VASFTPIRLVRLAADGSDRVAVIAAEPGSAAGTWLIRVGRGSSLRQLSTGTAYGPFAEADVEARAGELAATLEGEGYTRATDIDLILALSSANPAVRARAAGRLGWRRVGAAVGPLLKAGEVARGDVCAIADALGWIGDPAAIPFLRQLADRKNLSRRRSGVEALRNLGDHEAAAAASQRELARLPEAVTAALAAADEQATDDTSAQAIIDAIDDPRRIGLCADVLYERATPLGRRVALRLLRGDRIGQPHVWRYTKSVFKRAMLRHDAIAFAGIAREIERASLRSSGHTATVKSGLDGQQREMLIFGKKTQQYVLRAAWRYLRKLARYRPADYPRAATAILAHYGPEDLVEPDGLFGGQARAFLFHRILHRESARFVVSWYTLRHRFVNAAAVRPPSGVREEAFPELWDAHPQHFLRLLLRARWQDVLDFAEDGLARHPEVMQAASVAELLALVGLGRTIAGALAQGELSRRWDESLAAGSPDLALLDEVMDGVSDPLDELVRRWLDDSGSLWAVDPDRLLRYAECRHGGVRAFAMERAVQALRAAPAERRQELARQILERLRAGEPEVGLHAPLARLAATALAGEIEALLDTAELLELIRTGSNPAKELAGALLARRPDALELLGLEGVVALADHEVAAVRAASHAMLERSRPALEKDPSVLYALAESAWPDTRDQAAAILRSLPIDILGLDGIIGLCDSTHPQVQALGRELVVRHFDQLSADAVLFRLAEHPAQAMRRYVLDLVRHHLRPGAIPLMRIERFVRACLFDIKPARDIKQGLLDFLLERGLADERQAEVVAGLLGAVVRSRTDHDFQRVSAALARIQLAHPEVSSDLVVEPPP
jgi:hypothetical protein